MRFSGGDAKNFPPPIFPRSKMVPDVMLRSTVEIWGLTTMIHTGIWIVIFLVFVRNENWNGGFTKLWKILKKV